VVSDCHIVSSLLTVMDGTKWSCLSPFHETIFILLAAISEEGRHVNAEVGQGRPASRKFLNKDGL